MVGGGGGGDEGGTVISTSRNKTFFSYGQEN